MIYVVFREFIRWFYQLFFKKIYIQGFENIPKGKPVILAADHTNALVDPLVVAVFIRRHIYFLARADVFANKFLTWLFGQVHMRPIYRPRDGADYVEKNEKIFDEVNEWLLSKKAVLIFAEGNCVSQKRLRPLKKGTVRMGFKAWEEGADVYIVPTGINYTHHHKGRKELMISYGKPMRLEDYRASFEQNPAKAYREANRDLYNGIKQEMIVIEREETEKVVETLLEIGRNELNESRFPIMANNPKRLYFEQRIANKVNELFKKDNEAYEVLKTKSESYQTKLNSVKINDRAVRNSNRPNSLFVMLLAPFARLLGILFHYPYRSFYDKAQAMTKKDISMFVTVWTGLLMGVYVGFGFIWLIVGSLLLGIILTFGIGISIVFITYWTGIILEERKQDRLNSKAELLEIDKPSLFQELNQLRSELIDWIKN